MISVLLLLFCAPVEAQKITGKIIDQKLDPLSPSFFYENIRSVQGKKTISKTKYTDRSGVVLVEEEAEYENNTVLKYSYKQNQVGEVGYIESKDGKMHFSFSSQGNNETDQEDIEPNMVVADMIGDHIRNNWKALAAGDTIKFRFLLAERLDTIGFKLFTDKETIRNGVPVIDIIMKPSSIIIAALTNPLRFTVEKNEPHRILETFGRLPIRTSKPNPTKRSDWHAIDAMMELNYEPEKKMDKRLDKKTSKKK